MESALDRFYIEGVSSNIPFLRCVIGNPAFAAGNIDTKFVQEHYPGGFVGNQLSTRQEHELVAIAAFLEVIKSIRASATVTSNLPAANATAAAAAATLSQKEQREQLVVSVDGVETPLTLTHWPSDKHPVLRRAEVAVGDAVIHLEEKDPILSGKGLVHVALDGKDTVVSVLDELPRGFSLTYDGATKEEVLVHRADIAPLQRFMPKSKHTDLSSLIRAPLPGSVVNIAVRPKQKVLPGDELITIEAMKMRTVIRAEEPGVIRGIYVQQGATVKVGEMLIDFD
eukprot:TRINITY_DN14980_c1_g2_i1.p1 TRINITY_DN14980_c1_g2~~TRINITY_DN14980_c1_g2_i1.p1  ORF type:complete len:302 (+),score=34.64 TRINITY_DN14980_c1_g2_i1:58-906(+)